MQRAKCVPGMLTIAIVAAASPAVAATITYLQDLREIHASGGRDVGDYWVGGSNTAQPSPAFSDFSLGFSFPSGEASQFSLLRGDGMAANGFALGAYDLLEFGEGYSRFSIVFEVDETTPWILDGTFYRSQFIENEANARVVLSSGGTVIYSAALPPVAGTPGTPAYDDPLSLPVLATGVIGPGQYELLIEAVSNAGYGSYTFGFVVPEPGSAVLLLIGILGLGAWRHAGRQSR